MPALGASLFACFRCGQQPYATHEAAAAGSSKPGHGPSQRPDQTRSTRSPAPIGTPGAPTPPAQHSRPSSAYDPLTAAAAGSEPSPQALHPAHASTGAGAPSGRNSPAATPIPVTPPGQQGPASASALSTLGSQCSVTDDLQQEQQEQHDFFHRLLASTGLGSAGGSLGADSLVLDSCCSEVLLLLPQPEAPNSGALAHAASNVGNGSCAPANADATALQSGGTPGGGQQVTSGTQPRHNSAHTQLLGGLLRTGTLHLLQTADDAGGGGRSPSAQPPPQQPQQQQPADDGRGSGGGRGPGPGSGTPRLEEALMDNPRELLSGFSRLRLVGKGAHGSVHGGFYGTPPSIPVAVKVVACPELEGAFGVLREALLGRTLAHPNLVRTHVTRVAHFDAQAFESVFAMAAEAAAARRGGSASPRPVQPPLLPGQGLRNNRVVWDVRHPALSPAPHTPTSPLAAAAAARTAPVAIRSSSPVSSRKRSLASPAMEAAGPAAAGVLATGGVAVGTKAWTVPGYAAVPEGGRLPSIPSLLARGRPSVDLPALPYGSLLDLGSADSGAAAAHVSSAGDGGGLGGGGGGGLGGGGLGGLGGGSGINGHGSQSVGAGDGARVVPVSSREAAAVLQGEAPVAPARSGPGADQGQGQGPWRRQVPGVGLGTLPEAEQLLSEVPSPFRPGGAVSVAAHAAADTAGGAVVAAGPTGSLEAPAGDCCDGCGGCGPNSTASERHTATATIPSPSVITVAPPPATDSVTAVLLDFPMESTTPSDLLSSQPLPPNTAPMRVVASHSAVRSVAGTSREQEQLSGSGWPLVSMEATSREEGAACVTPATHIRTALACGAATQAPQAERGSVEQPRPAGPPSHTPSCSSRPSAPFPLLFNRPAGPASSPKLPCQCQHLNTSQHAPRLRLEGQAAGPFPARLPGPASASASAPSFSAFVPPGGSHVHAPAPAPGRALPSSASAASASAACSLRDVLVGCGATPGSFVVVVAMEWCGLGTLEALCRKDPFCPVSTRPLAVTERSLLGLAVQVAEGLAHLHAHSVLHGDIKPANVLLARGTSADTSPAASAAAAQGSWRPAGEGPPLRSTSRMRLAAPLRSSPSRLGVAAAAAAAAAAAVVAESDAAGRVEPTAPAAAAAANAAPSAGQGGPQPPDVPPAPHQGATPSASPPPALAASQPCAPTAAAAPAVGRTTSRKGARQQGNNDGPLVAKLADFGLSRLLERSFNDEPDVGTVAYAAPERLSHRSGLPSDIYSMGMMLWQMASGCRPYEQLTTAQVLFGVLYQGLRPQWPEGRHPHLRPLFERCVAREAAARPTAGELVRELRAMELAARKRAREGAMTRTNTPSVYI